MSIKGYKELSEQIAALGDAAGAKVLRSAARAAMKPALEAAERAAPVAEPPYTYPYGTVDPYPKKTYKGRYVTPGFASRNIVLVTSVDKDKNTVRVRLGPRKEAFYTTQFLELGTSKIAKRPWLEPAFRGALAAVDAALKTELRKKLDAAVRRGKRAIARELANPL